MSPANTPAQRDSSPAEPAAYRHQQPQLQPQPQSPPPPPPRTPSPSAYHEALRNLGSPVPDLASTLHTLEDDIEAENVSFLRTRLSPPPEEPPRRRQPSQSSLQEQRMEWRRSLLEQQLESGRQRFAEARAQLNPTRRPEQPSSPYNESYNTWVQRMLSRPGDARETETQNTQIQPDEPPPLAQQMYEWASTQENLSDDHFEDFLAELREQQPNTHPEVLRVLARASVDAEREARNRVASRMAANAASAGSQDRNPHDSLRSAAILQSVRRNHRFSARSRDLMQRYVLDRERVVQSSREASTQEGSRAASNRSLAAALGNGNGNGNSSSTEPARTWYSSQTFLTMPSALSNNDGRGGVEHLRRRYLEQPASKTPTLFERIIKYLHVLRSSAEGHQQPDGIDGEAARTLHDEMGEYLSRDHELRHLIGSRLGSRPLGDDDKTANASGMGSDSNPESIAVDRVRHLEPARSNDRREHEHEHEHDAPPRPAPSPLTSMDVCAPHPSSWLAPGTLFVGHQQAAPVVSSAATLSRLANSELVAAALQSPLIAHQPAQAYDVSRPWLDTNTFSASPQPRSPNPPPSQPAAVPGIPDRWTVKVSVHAVDYDSMTLQGTMEAFNVPSVSSQQPASTSTSTSTPPTHLAPPGQPQTPSIPASPAKTTFSTYLEGELIDFTTHTLLTESETFLNPSASTTSSPSTTTAAKLKTTPDIDAAYWRKLSPFASMSDDEIARALLDRDWIESELMGRYVLMRWKERCFVKPCLTGEGASDCLKAARGSGAGANAAILGAAGAATLGAGAGAATLGAGAGAATLGAGAGVASSGAGAAAGAAASNARAPNGSTTATAQDPTSGQNYGLSISGFYYVSMRRSDGRCEGLYFDPQSSPYQHLELRPSVGTWGMGAWEFR